MAPTILTANDYQRSCTCFSLGPVTSTLQSVVDSRPLNAMLDVGCGYGGIAASLASALAVTAVHGIDVDERVIDEARGKGVDATVADVDADGLPYPDGTFDLVTSFGMLDYLPWFDRAVVEISRVLTPGGTVAISLPNLASWHNRIALLLGYQPRDVEFSSVRAVGIAPFYTSHDPVGHIHTPTTRAFRAYMTMMGFDEARTVALRPDNDPPHLVMRLLDAVLGRTAASARRFLYLGHRTREPASRIDGWWAGPPGSTPA